LLKIRKICLRGTPAGDGDKDPSWGNFRPMLTDDFAHLSAETISGDSISQALACD
jgi:hypothetical protein